MNKKVGTPTAPVDPSTVEPAAEKEYSRAVVRTGGCTTPLIVENELFGASIPTPWSASTAQYRANVLALLQDLAARGAHPVLLINKSPYAGSTDAIAWWRSVAKVADIVREVYLPATEVWPLGPILGNRLLRRELPQRGHRRHVDRDSGEPGRGHAQLPEPQGGRRPQRPEAGVGLVPGREVGGPRGEAGRARGRARLGLLLGLAGVEQKGDGPGQAQGGLRLALGPEPDALQCAADARQGLQPSLIAGQIHLLHHTVCSVEGLGSIGAGAVGSLEALTGDRNAALSAMFERLVESSEHRVSRHAVLAAQREVIRESFHGSRSAYVAALRQAHATPGVARSVLADELRRARLELPRYAPRPTGTEVAAFYSAYPDLLVRRVRVTPAPPWLAARTSYALAESAPQQLFSLPLGRKSRLSTLLGTFAVRPLGPSQSLGALPLADVRPAIVAALRGFERAQSFERWTITQQTHALNRTICQRDELPQPAAIDLTEYLPFLRVQ